MRRPGASAQGLRHPKHPDVQRWLARHKRFHRHFTPTSSSWLNLVERWLRELTDTALRRGSLNSVPELIAPRPHPDPLPNPGLGSPHQSRTHRARRTRRNTPGRRRHRRHRSPNQTRKTTGTPTAETTPLHLTTPQSRGGAVRSAPGATHQLAQVQHPTESPPANHPPRPVFKLSLRGQANPTRWSIPPMPTRPFLLTDRSISTVWPGSTTATPLTRRNAGR